MIRFLIYASVALYSVAGHAVLPGTTVTDLGVASLDLTREQEKAQQKFDNKVWSFLKDHHGIRSVNDLFQVIIDKRKEFKVKGEEEIFIELVDIVRKNGTAVKNKLQLKDIDFKIISVSELNNFPNGSAIENRKGFIIQMILNTATCATISYSVNLLVEYNKLDVLSDPEYHTNSNQTITQLSHPCY